MDIQIRPVTLLEIACEVTIPRVITFIGGGGKTSLMYLWARSLQASGFSVATTSTTRLSAQALPEVRIAQPASLSEAAFFLRTPTTAREILTLSSYTAPAGDKLLGIPPAWIDSLCQKFPDTFFLVEGDGSAGRSLKGHLPHEPVIPASTSLLVPVIGLDVLGKTLDNAHIHRPDVFSRITGTPSGGLIGPAEVFTALFHPEGYLCRALQSTTILPLLNKMETCSQWETGKIIATQILASNHPQISAVLAGSVHNNCFVRLS